MIWNYGFTKLKRSSWFNETYITYCGMLVCTRSGGIFERGGKYPYYYKNGHDYIVAIDMFKNQATVYELDLFCDCYKIAGCTEEEQEDATFVEEEV